MLKWILALLSLAVVLVVGPFVAGMFITKRHVAASTIMLSQPADSVWLVVRDLGGYPAWWRDIKRSERDPDAGDGEVWIQTDGQGQELPLRVVQAIQPSLLVTEIAGGELPFSGRWTFEIERTGMGSRVTLTEEGEVFNPVFRFMARMFLGYHGSIDRCLEGLGRRFGEQVTVTHLPQS